MKTSGQDIEKILNSIEQLNETQLSLYIKIRSKEKSKPNNIIKEYYEDKILDIVRYKCVYCYVENVIDLCIVS